MVATTDTVYTDAVAAATDPTAWDGHAQVELTVDGIDATMVEATALTDASGLEPGTSRLAYLIDYGASGTVMLFTTGQAGDEGYASDGAVLTIMVDQSTFAVPGS
jgi:hypothetical protein